jgi:hypothetical protein
MELKTQALDRVLEALSPALAAELDRVVNETREALEQEFQKRLQTEVREAENAVRKNADAELQRALSDARESTRKQTEELEQRFEKTLEETTAAIRSFGRTRAASGTTPSMAHFCRRAASARRGIVAGRDSRSIHDARRFLRRRSCSVYQQG